MPIAQTPPDLSFGSIVLRILGSAALGGVVALLFLLSRRPAERSKGLAQTLVLLAPLIAMVTVAVGDNVAAAFTLVGTLAIVRFRTAVRDTRDTAYVIFAVAVGMAMGTMHVAIAVGGTLLIGAVVVALRRLELARPPAPPRATLRLAVTPPDVDPAAWRSILSGFAESWNVARADVDRRAQELELRLTLEGSRHERAEELLAALLARPEVARAQYTAAEDSA